MNSVKTLARSLRALTAYRRFVNYTLTPDPDREGKTIKRPVDVVGGFNIAVTDTARQYSHDEAAATGRPVGFVFNEADGFWFLDIDNCLEDTPAGPAWSGLATGLVNRLAGCALEVSQSGKGLHLIGRGTVPEHSCRNVAFGLELYTHDRFVALTGLQASGDAGKDLTPAISAVAAEFFPPNAHGEVTGWTDQPVEEWSGPADDEALIKIALASGKRSVAAAFGDATTAGGVTFEDLWTANADKLAAKWPSNKADFSHSRADAALAGHLAFWTGKNHERIRALMFKSALVADRWTDRPEWLETTIMRAASVVANVANGSPPAKPLTRSGSWEEPDLTVLHGPNVAAPVFPRAALGPYWAKWCEMAADGANAPFDYAAAGLITVAAALIGNARTVAASASWAEPSLLWTALIGGPSAGKSPALDPLARIVTAMEADLAISFENTDHSYQSAAQIAKMHDKQWQDESARAIKEGREPLPKPPAAMEPSPPARPRIYLSDTTMEAAAEIAAGNPNGLLLYRDELAGWWRSFGRYTGSDGERQFWLQAYGGRPYTVDRKKAGKPIIVHRLSISALGGVQPDVLSTMLDGEADGFAARFLFVFPEPTTGFTLDTPAADIVGATAALRSLYSLSMIDDGETLPRPFVCRLDRQAAAFFEIWWRARKRVASDAIGLWGHWLGKQGGVALRIALVLEHLWSCSPANSPGSADSFPSEISEAAIRAATGLIENWAGPMAQRSIGAAAASPQEADAAALARWLRSQGKPQFNAREVQRSGNGPGGRLNKAAGMKAACDALEQAGIVRRCGVRADGKPGRAPSDYEVNQLLIG